MFTAKDVMNLREMSGAGMMDCKKALTECNGDMDKAMDYLREKSLAASAVFRAFNNLGVCRLVGLVGYEIRAVDGKVALGGFCTFVLSEIINVAYPGKHFFDGLHRALA